MAAASEEDDLVDVVVRLPRKAIERSLLSLQGSEQDLQRKRLGEANALLTGRRRRTACFAGIRFSDPCWDMILELYVTSRERRVVAISQLCSLSGASATTALRHIEHLEALGYVGRDLDPDDRRRANVTMLPQLEQAVEQWLDLQLAASNIGC